MEKIDWYIDNQRLIDQIDNDNKKIKLYLLITLKNTIFKMNEYKQGNQPPSGPYYQDNNQRFNQQNNINNQQI